MWTYSQSSGVLTDPNGRPFAQGYSGNKAGLDNPQMQDTHNVGPLPQGEYTIGTLQPLHDRLGEDVLPLEPNPSNQMFGRSGFFLHGDNEFLNHTASDGCVILPRWVRLRIAESDDKGLRVTV